MEMKKPKPLWLAQTEVGVRNADALRTRARIATARLVAPPEIPPTRPVPLPRNVLHFEPRPELPDIVA